MTTSLRSGAATLGQHVLTFCAVMGVMWTMARPAAQQFVENTLSERISSIESQITALQQQQTASDIAQNEVRRRLEEIVRQQRAEGVSDDEILRLLRAMSAR